MEIRRSSSSPSTSNSRPSRSLWNGCEIADSFFIKKGTWSRLFFSSQSHAFWCTSAGSASVSAIYFRSISTDPSTNPACRSSRSSEDMSRNSSGFLTLMYRFLEPSSRFRKAAQKAGWKRGDAPSFNRSEWPYVDANRSSVSASTSAGTAPIMVGFLLCRITRTLESSRRCRYSPRLAAVSFADLAISPESAPPNWLKSNGLFRSSQHCFTNSTIRASSWEGSSGIVIYPLSLNGLHEEEVCPHWARESSAIFHRRYLAPWFWQLLAPDGLAIRDATRAINRHAPATAPYCIAAARRRRRGLRYRKTGARGAGRWVSCSQRDLISSRVPP